MCTLKQYLLGVLLLAAGLSCAQDKGEESKFGVTELLAINRTDGKVRWGYYVGRAESRAVELRDGNAQVVIRSSDACLEFDCVNAFDMEDGVAVDLAEPDETVEPENPCSELTLDKVGTAYLIGDVCVGLGTDDPSSVFAYDVDSQEELWSKTLNVYARIQEAPVYIFLHVLYFDILDTVWIPLPGTTGQQSHLEP